MTYQEIAKMIEGIGLPYAYYQFEEKTGQEPPFICFYYPEDSDLHADNVNYQSISNLIIELYTDEKNFLYEQKVEQTLKENGLSWHKEETYIDEELMYMVAYNMEVCINDEQ